MDSQDPSPRSDNPSFVPPSPPVIPPPIISGRPSQRTGSGRGWRIFAVILLVLFVITFLGNHLSDGRVAVKSHRFGHKLDRPLEEIVVEEKNSAAKIALIEINGVISSESMDRNGLTLAELVSAQFKAAADDHQVKAVILKVDSPGGEVLASDEINKVIQQFQKETSKPVVASMGALAASGGYYVSVPCQWIVANELTLTGSIGVIMHGYNLRGLMDKLGIQPQTYKSGQFKDMMSMDKKEEDITPEERALVQNLVNETFNKFKSVVQEGRAQANQRRPKGQSLSADWMDYADGRVLSGKQAFDHGFVDELGNFQAAVDRAEEMVGIQKANLIEYRQPFNLGSFFRLFGKTETPALKIDLGANALRLKAGHLYFLMPTVLR